MEFKLILKKINKTLTEEETLIFDAWFSESETHREYFYKVQEHYLTAPDTVDIQKGWGEVSSKIAPKSNKAGYWKYAAAIAAVLLLGIFVFVQKPEHPVEVTPEVVETNAIEIGTDKATLTLEDGSHIVLEKGASFKGENLTSNGEHIVYNTTPKSAEVDKPVAYNVLTIPRGGQFFITLSDGTKVWLNSDSQLRYPVTFASNKPRHVELVYGEAYFDVSPSLEHNNTHFIVNTHEQDIDVLGTEFNVKAYREDPVIATTLVEGKVLVTSADVSEQLVPGQQSRLHIGTDQIDISEVNVSDVISWKDGFFSFKDKPLKEIMLVLSRWYDIEVFMENEAAGDIKFNGVFNKKQHIENILKIIENTHEVKFETKGKTVKVK
ncbi:FecR family protein [Snuella lapsa]|uniref:FecR family protein n=1 Tax=Snuella lapsa TaxID=870481 RepID=A0ABP6Y8K9_9FLAO